MREPVLVCAFPRNTAVIRGETFEHRFKHHGMSLPEAAAGGRYFVSLAKCSCNQQKRCLGPDLHTRYLASPQSSIGKYLVQYCCFCKTSALTLLRHGTTADINALPPALYIHHTTRAASITSASRNLDMPGVYVVWRAQAASRTTEGTQGPSLTPSVETSDCQLESWALLMQPCLL